MKSLFLFANHILVTIVTYQSSVAYLHDDLNGFKDNFVTILPSKREFKSPKTTNKTKVITICCGSTLCFCFCFFKWNLDGVITVYGFELLGTFVDGEFEGFIGVVKVDEESKDAFTNDGSVEWDVKAFEGGKEVWGDNGRF